MINLLPKNEQDKIKRSRYQRATYAVTTWLLVVYVVALAALAGWWFFLAKTETQVSAEVASLTSQLNKLAAKEVLLRQYRERLGKVDTAFKNHLKLSDQLAKAFPPADLTILGWDFDGKSQALKVASSDTTRVQSFADNLKVTFKDIVVKSLTRQDKPEWQITLQVDKL